MIAPASFAHADRKSSLLPRRSTATTTPSSWPALQGLSPSAQLSPLVRSKGPSIGPIRPIGPICRINRWITLPLAARSTTTSPRARLLRPRCPHDDAIAWPERRPHAVAGDGQADGTAGLHQGLDQIADRIAEE
ncbi:MAG: hypothetical protein HYX94_11295 [Chloroflexi bacterium]|nr:hypothetical protein [Chloroflexota bacterium]